MNSGDATIVIRIEQVQVVLGPGTPKSSYTFTMGGQKLKIVSFYKHPGIEETGDGQIFMQQKWLKVKRRVPQCQKVGAKGDGLTIKVSEHCILVRFVQSVESAVCDTSSICRL